MVAGDAVSSNAGEVAVIPVMAPPSVNCRRLAIFSLSLWIRSEPFILNPTAED
jgi:hypothetical protein